MRDGLALTLRSSFRGSRNFLSTYDLTLRAAYHTVFVQARAIFLKFYVDEAICDPLRCHLDELLLLIRLGVQEVVRAERRTARLQYDLEVNNARFAQHFVSNF